MGWPRRVEEILYRMRGLRMIGTVLHVGTHPDDEDAGLMSFVARKYGARMVYWSATRGEAGQNRLAAYSGDALGIYRTWESLDARAIDGGESLYGPFYDFGFCANGAEATTKWGRTALVREIVRAIRLVQPQILVARFSGNASDGHGQHQAVGSATTEAFDAAADPTLFPELGLPAWRTPKLYQSTGGDWQAGEAHSMGTRQPAFECDGFLRIDTGEYDPVAGISYQQVACAAFNSHRTQAMGFLPEHGSFFYYYKLAKSLVAPTTREDAFYDGLDPTLPGLVDYLGGGPSDLRETLEATRSAVDSALLRLRPDDPSPAVEPLVEGLAMLRRMRAQTDDGHAIARQLDDKIASFEDVIVACLGVDAECTADRAHVAAGERVRIRGTLWNPRGVDLEDCRLLIDAPDGWEITPVSTHDSGHQIDWDVTVAPNARPTTPFWLREPHDRYRYRVSSKTFACEAFDRAPVALVCQLVVAGQRLTFSRPALRRESFAGGYRELPLAVLPAISVRPQVDRVFLPVGAEPHELELPAAIHRHVDAASHTVQLRVAVPEGWTVNPSFVEFPARTQDVTSARFRVTAPGDMTAGRYRLEFLLGSGEAQPALTLEPVWMGAPGLPRPPDAATCIREAFLSAPAHVDIHVMSARFARGLNYGYVRGAAEGLLEALDHFGLSISQISDEEMSYVDLSSFDGIIVGPNAYLIREELRRNAGRFLDYVESGGTLIVQYQAYGYELRDFTPYPFDYSHPHDRVTYPDAPITVFEPLHPLMTHPNQITEEDFAGWIHDRGLYFFGTFDDRYTSILGCRNEPGEALKRGGLLAAGYGRGAFVYVAYSLFRQVPAAVPGAFRLLANLLALPEALLLERVERLRTLSLFSFMTDEQLMVVARIVSESHKTAGTYLCRQGELGQELFIVIKGEVEIVKRTDSGVVLLKAREGQVVGEFAILADIPRTADLRALTNVHLLAISSVHFRALIRQYAEIAEGVIQQLVMKLVVD